MKLIYILPLIFTLFFNTACSGKQAKNVELGKASWYGEKYHGKQTASGEIYDMYALTAAHKTLAFHTKVRVTNLRNNRSMIVRINDRGPFVRGRIIDLSFAAAEELDFISEGVVNVKVEKLLQ